MRAGSGDLMRRVEVSSQNALDKILKELIKLLHLKKRRRRKWLGYPQRAWSTGMGLHFSGCNIYMGLSLSCDSTTSQEYVVKVQMRNDPICTWFLVDGAVWRM